MADWSQLLSDLLVTIVERLSIPDFLIFSGVCVSWRQARLKATVLQVRPKRQPPWLMVPGDAEDTASFFALSDGKLRSIPLPEPKIRSRVCIGSSNGWLITFDQLAEMHLLNPITRSQISLPPVSTFYFVEKIETEFLVSDVDFLKKQGMWNGGLRLDDKPVLLSLERMRRCFFRKAILLGDGSAGNEFTVFLLHEPGWSLAFARAGDKAWTSLSTPKAFVDIIPHRDRYGRFYTVTFCGIVQVWEPNGSSSFNSRVVVKVPLVVDYEALYFPSMAESPTGELMLLLRDIDEQTIGFRVILVDVRKREWAETTDIGDLVVFVGLNCSMCLSTEEFPGLRRNCIYFTEGFLDIMEEEDKRDVGIFDLKEGMMVTFESGGLPRLNWPPPIWFTPSLS